MGIRPRLAKQAWAALSSAARSLVGRVAHRRRQPPDDSGVREPGRPRPTLPGSAVALAEPQVRRRIRLRVFGRRDDGGLPPATRLAG
jgi:hypothetical protein